MNKIKYVVLDAGHGKYTPGKRSPVWPDGRQYFEWKGMREIREVIIKEGEERFPGVKFIRLTNSENDVPLSTRKQIANRFDKDKSILISLHSNASKNPHAFGFEAFTWPGDSFSDRIANQIVLEANHILPYEIGRGIRVDSRDKDLDKEAKFTILSSRLYSVLVEFAFHTNKEECTWLMNDEDAAIRHKDFSDIILNALSKFF